MTKKAAVPIRLRDFTGMNNIRLSEGLFVGRGQSAQPRITLNADVTSRGRLVKRDGSTKIISFTTAHSLWACQSAMMCADSGYLYRIHQLEKTQICAITGPQDEPLSYAEYDGKIYISNAYWNKVFEPSTNVASQWGINTPEQPVVSSTNGNLPAGTYKLCFTKFVNRDIGGNGPIAEITVTADQGITISNRPADAIVWMTDTDDNKFYLVGELDTIVTLPGVSEPLPSFMCAPPPCLEYITYVFGRMWGFDGNDLLYSEPLHPNWFRPEFNKIEFDQKGTMIAYVPTGLFIGCEDITYFYEGNEPHLMKEHIVGSGAIPGTLAYCNNIPELGDILSPAEKIHVNVPVWLSQEGIVIGNSSGRLFNLTQQKVRFKPGQRGASVHRMKDGEFQFLTSFKQGSAGSGIGMSDTATVEVIRNGKVFDGEWSEKNQDGVGFSDTVELEINP
jgi:hypothetical protein